MIAIPLGLFIGLDRDHLLDVDRADRRDRQLQPADRRRRSRCLLAAAPAASAALAEVASLDPERSQTLLRGRRSTPLIGRAQRAAAAAPRAAPVPRAPRPRARRRPAARRPRRAARSRRTCSTRSATRLEELLRPDGIAIYGRATSLRAGRRARARDRAAFRRRGPLARCSSRPASALDVARLRRRGRRGALARAPSARRSTPWASQLVVPLFPTDELVAFLCLGQKESGDIYTETDRALLQALADRVLRRAPSLRRRRAAARGARDDGEAAPLRARRDRRGARRRRRARGGRARGLGALRRRARLHELRGGPRGAGDLREREPLHARRVGGGAAARAAPSSSSTATA